MFRNPRRTLAGVSRPSGAGRCQGRRRSAAFDIEQTVQKAYQIAEDKDLEGWVAAFTDDGTFTLEHRGRGGPG
jgi:hypothetical protein